MNYTKNYQLSRRSMEDRIQMQDFNSGNRRLDTELEKEAGLGSRAEAAALSALCKM